MSPHRQLSQRATLLAVLGIFSLLCLLLGSGPIQAQAKPAAAAAASPAAAEYRLGAGDTVRISVYQSPDLTVDARIGESGQLSYPLLGSIKLGGLTVAAAERLIADGLKNGNFLRAPQVSVFVSQVRGNQASVLGQVNRPGRFPLEAPDLRLSDLLAMAGGIAISGADSVIVVGSRNGQRFRQEVDLSKLFGSANSDADMLMLNGDVLFVERAPVAYIYGEVQRPGAMRLERGLTVLQALATGGGLTQRGTQKGLRLHRKTADGKLQVLEPAMDEALRDGDVVYVRESLF